MSRDVEIRTLSLNEVAQLVAWAGQEGWNPSPDDAKAFFAADPAGFLGCFVDGALVSGISAISYGEAYGFIGLYITRPAFRGQGYGLNVWNAAMARLTGRTIGLDGVPAQQENYQKMGFRKAYETTRWSGTPSALTKEQNIENANSHVFNELLPFDSLYFPEDRSDFLASWIRVPRTCFIVRCDGKVAGYAVIRACLEGFKVGPLFARNIATARSLLAACGTVADGETLHLDVPDLQVDFGQYLKDCGFNSSFATARMYLGPPPQVEMSGIFAITTLELG